MNKQILEILIFIFKFFFSFFFFFFFFFNNKPLIVGNSQESPQQ